MLTLTVHGANYAEIIKSADFTAAAFFGDELFPKMRRSFTCDQLLGSSGRGIEVFQATVEYGP